MELTLFAIIILFIAGFLGGAFVSMSSGTTWPIMVPALTIVLGNSLFESVGTALLVDCIVGLVAGLVFLRRGHVDLKAVYYIGIPGMIMAYIGSFFTSNVKETNLTIFVGLILIVLGYIFVSRGISQNIEAVESKVDFSIFRKHKHISLPISGALIGLLCGFFGMGSGGNVMLVLVLIIGYSLHESVGTALITMFFIAGAGAIGQAQHTGILLESGLIAGLGAAVAALSGSLIATYLNEDKLGRAIGLIIAALGGIMLVKPFVF